MLLILGASGGSGTSEENVKMNGGCYCYTYCPQIKEIIFFILFFFFCISYIYINLKKIRHPEEFPSSSSSIYHGLIKAMIEICQIATVDTT